MGRMHGTVPGRCLALLWLLLVLAMPAAARTVLELDTARQPVPLADWGDTWMDPTGQADVRTAAGSSSIPWKPSRADTIYRMGPERALWVRFTVPPAPDAERWYLEVPYPSVNLVTLYAQDSVGEWTAQEAGDTLPVASWPVPHRHPLLPINVSAEEPRKYLVRIRNPYSFAAPLQFVSESHLSRQEQRTSLVLGLFFGLVGLAVVLCVLSAASLRDTAYAIYALAVTLLGLMQAAITGIGGLHLWPHAPRWNDVSPLVLSVLAVGATLWFTAVLVSLPQRAPQLHRAVLAFALLGVPAAVVVGVVDPGVRFPVMMPYIVAVSVTCVAVTAWAWRRGDRWGPLLLLGITPVIATGMFPLLRAAGVIPASFWTMHGMQVGIALMLPLVMTMLMLRSQHRREHNRRIQGLDRIDPATGLINAAVFRERLVRLIARSLRLKLRSAVLLVAITNIEQIRRNYDQRSAEELPLRVAGRLLGVAREIDSVARLSQNTFGILLEGPLTAQEVAAAAPRVVARCLMPFEKKPLEWVAQVHVAQALVPMDGTDAEALLQKLEALLASAPAESRRAVYLLNKAPATTS